MNSICFKGNENVVIISELTNVSGMEMKLKINQFIHESETWKRCLKYVQDENNFLKRRLSEVLKKDAIDDFLDKAEYFQNEFLSEDNILNVLRFSISELDKLVLRDDFEDVTFIREFLLNQKKLNKDIEKVENHFSHLKSEFNNFLYEVL